MLKCVHPYLLKKVHSYLRKYVHCYLPFTYKTQNSAFYSILAPRKGTPDRIFEIGEFESAERTLAGIEIINIIRKNQINDSKSTSYKTFNSLAV